jgi:serine/threonine protein phosphatase PrpC
MKEDAIIVEPNFDKNNTSLFGVLDGHGGKRLKIMKAQ